MNTTGSDNESYKTTENSVDLNDRYAASLLPLTVIFGFLLGLGIIGNLLTLFVFSLNRDYRRNTFKVYVIALALIDLSTCITLFPTEIMTHRYYFIFKTASLCKAKCFMTVFGAAASCLALLVISVDRYRKVMQPLRRQFTPSFTAVLLFLAIVIFPVLLAVPATIMCGIHNTTKVNIYGGQTEVFVCETEEKFKHSKWRTIYKFVLIILQLVISVVYMILYAFVMKEAVKHIRAFRTRESICSALAQTKPALESDVAGNKQNNHVLDKNNDGMPNICEKMIKNDSTPTESFSPENENDNSGDGTSVQNDTPRNSPSISGVKVKKSKSLISKRSQISVLSQRIEFPTKTLVWFVLTIIFIVTNLTHLGLSLRRQDIVHMSTTDLFCFLVFFRLYFINHVINPVVYAVFLKSFRTSCKHIFSMIKNGMNFKRTS